jgi:hypothetical protein
MAGDIQTVLEEARALDLFKPHGAFEVHCSNCHARLNSAGDCASCGLIGQSQSAIEQRARTDPAAIERLLTAAIEKRKGHTPARRGAKSQER